jgi:CheY-like chemotaxis protein
MVDPNQLQNAILNLAFNARDAMPGGGSLLLEARIAELDADQASSRAEVQPGRYLMLSVTDTGTGMTPEVRERAFEPFFTTKSPGAGTGLGLAMVYGFARQSGGHVQIYSEPNLGTTVNLYLPPAECPQEIRSPNVSPPLGSVGRGELILVVEDDPRVRRYAVAKLGSLNYRVIEAADGPAALDAVARSSDIDLLFSDIVMPGGMSGRDLAEKTRAINPKLRVLLTSGYAAPEVLLRGLAEGARWLRKPYGGAELARAVREALDDVPSG